MLNSDIYNILSQEISDMCAGCVTSLHKQPRHIDSWNLIDLSEGKKKYSFTCMPYEDVGSNKECTDYVNYFIYLM